MKRQVPRVSEHLSERRGCGLGTVPATSGRIAFCGNEEGERWSATSQWSCGAVRKRLRTSRIGRPESKPSRPVAATPTNANYLLNWSSQTYRPNFPSGSGRPWGDGSAYAQREGSSPPWDTGCDATPLVGGFAVLRSMREDLEQVISNGSGGHVYIADWRFDMLRDLSENNPWRTNSWSDQSGPSLPQANADQTAIGLLLRLMQAGVQVRLLVWSPDPGVASALGHQNPRIINTFHSLLIVAAENSRIASSAASSSSDVGVFAIDQRTANRKFATHHQKLLIIRSPSLDVAYCGGVDLAFTRRSGDTQGSPPTSSFIPGDWQSGSSIPNPGDVWPRDATTNYTSVDKVFSEHSSNHDPQEPNDLPIPVYGSGPQLWHDQSLRVQGPFVTTLEQAFCERWIDTGVIFSGAWGSQMARGQCQFSSENAVTYRSGASPDTFLPATGVVPLPNAAATPSPSSAAAIVQLWRTIPYRKERFSAKRLPAFCKGEFTVQAGLSNAIGQSSELIWIFDQYFWSRPTAKQLNAQLVLQPNLYVIIVLPPHADDWHDFEHWARSAALADLRGTDPSVSARVGVYDLWQQSPGNGGIYCHAKVQMFDDQLLVCGSANINVRSHQCDTELDAAVLSQSLVRAHQSQLLGLLLDESPSIPYGRPGWGKVIFDAVKASSTALPSSDVTGWLVVDPWDQVAATSAAKAGKPYVVTFPNGATATLGELNAIGTFYLDPPVDFYDMYHVGLDPTSLPDDSCGDDWSLDQVVQQLEQQPNRPWEKKP
jgi:phosphatidylserine/phosphatidylglycerophosphate/cardiolipin synthase-like enzyme